MLSECAILSVDTLCFLFGHFKNSRNEDVYIAKKRKKISWPKIFLNLNKEEKLKDS